MATTTRMSVEARNAALDAQAALFNNGYLRLYSGAQPATPNTAASGTLLAELRFGATAFPAASGGGPLVANAITDDASADASGTPGYYRCLKSDGVTPINDGEVGTSGANLNMDSSSIVAGARISITSFQHALPMQEGT
jgi:hypothetical protein